MTAEKILKKILFEKGYCNKLGNQARIWKNRFKLGKLSPEKMKEIVELAGYEKYQDQLFKLKK